ncbi:hypothetical protein GJAV_G00154590 [Gymnothorax javanicus]|nr:hypothetical protein GJAV_G00154590 [Gymnothorax javanicus]
MGMMRQDRERQLMEAFKALDKDGSGYINKAEVHELMKKLGFNQIDVDEMMKAMDVDGDGRLCYGEFIVRSTLR